MKRLTLILITTLCTLSACHNSTSDNTTQATSPTSTSTVTQTAPRSTTAPLTPTVLPTEPTTTPSPLPAYSGLLPQDKETIGVNLEGLADWSSGLCFVDAMLTARTFGTPKACWQEGTIKMDAQGWPLEDAGVVIHADMTNADISGTYHLSFEGTADVEPYFGVKAVNVRQENGMTYADIIVPEGCTSLMIDFINTKGGVRNVRLIRPGYPADTTQVFTNEFLKALEPFSTIRFMDWLATNQQNSYDQDPWYSSEDLIWTQRKQPNHASQAATYGPARGAAWEYIIELGNTTGKDIWINIPVQADNAYIAALARLLHETLSPERTVYVEYSNEVWNWSFPQANYNMNRGKSEEKIMNYVKEKKLEGSEWALQYANRTAQIADIFRAEYGTDAMNKQICIVLAWQFGWDPVWFFTEMFQFIEEEYGAPKDYIYTLSIAPYFSEPLPEDCTDVDTILTYMQESSNESAAERQKVINLAKAYNLPGKVSCYEGGPHHQGQAETNLTVRMESHRSAAMENIVTEDITTNFKNLGGGLFMYYTLSGNYGKYGCWGAVHSFDDLDTPKYQALKTLAE